MKKLIVCLMLVALSMPAYAGIIGTWEDTSGDGWIDWGNSKSIADSSNAAKYTFLSTTGVTNVSYSLKVTPPSGWQQNLGIKLNETQRADFLANTIFAIDVTYDSGSWPSGTTYAQVYQLSLNASNYGWNDVGGAGAPTGQNGVVFTDTLNPGSPGGLPIVNPGTPGTTLTGTWMWDYSAILPGGSYSGNKISATPGYIEMIFALNSNQAGAYYLDNARLIPEPATIALLGLGGLALLRKRHA